MVEMKSTMGVELIDFMGSDARVVQAARVSTKGAAAAGDSESAGLINFLVRNKHNSVLEHCMFTFLVHAPIFVVNQMVRHKSHYHNIESGRYRELEPVFYTPPTERPLVQVGKTGNYDFEQADPEQVARVSRTLRWAAEDVWDDYTTLLEQGIAKEVARMVLPLNIYSSMYVTMNARSLMHFCDQRLAHEAQYEIREVAQKFADAFADKMPLTHAAWESTRGHSDV